MNFNMKKSLFVGVVFWLLSVSLTFALEASPAGGSYVLRQWVTLSGSGNIHFTVDGTTPSTSSTLYTAPILIDESTTLKFFSSDTPGDIRVETYNIDILPAWTRQIGTPNGDVYDGYTGILGDIAYDVSVDLNGNVYITGATSGGLEGNAHAGSADVYIASYDTEGNLRWLNQIGSAEYDRAYGVTAHSDGSSYIVGQTSGGLDGNVNAGSSDAFIAKYDPNGNMLWLKQIGTPASDRAQVVALDSAGNVFVTGFTTGDLNGITNQGGSDVFLSKYDPNGNMLWMQLLGTSGNEYPFDLTVDALGNIYITGSEYGSLDGNINAGGMDIFIAKYDNDGNKIWTDQIGTPERDQTWGITVDSDNYVYIAGLTTGVLEGQTNAGGRDVYIAKYSPDGAMIWSRQWGTAFDDTARDIAIDRNGILYVMGNISNPIDGGEATGNDDILIMQLDRDGNLLKQTLGTDRRDVPHGIAFDNNNNIFVAGKTSGGLDGNINAGNDNYDIFVMKFSANTLLPILGQASVSSGSNVVATPTIDSSLNFDSVSGNGTVTIIEDSTSPDFPSNLRVITGSSYHIITNATYYTGGIQVCLSYDDAALFGKNNEHNIKLFHYNGQHWEDITSNIDLVDNQVCGVTDSLSPFAAMEPDGPYTITSSTGTSDGSISPLGGIQVVSGNTQTFTVTPGLGYQIDSVAGCGGSLVGNTYTTAPINADCTVTATFTPLQTTHTLDVTVIGEGSVYIDSEGGAVCTDNCVQAYVEDTTVPLYISRVGNGYGFAGWTGDCTGTGDCFVAMDTAKNVTATFLENVPNPVILEGSPGSFTTIQFVYDGLTSGQVATIKVKAGLQNSENLIFERDVTLRLEGGYDHIFTNIIGDTSFYGTLTIKGGSATISDLIIK